MRRPVLGAVRPPESNERLEPAGLLRPKRTLSRTELWWLGALALAPLLIILVRALALPGAMGSGALGEIGGALNQVFSLSDVPPHQRGQILYLLFIPTCALLVALVRLTLGIRVLGFRSILIAVGFHQSGVVASLLLITVAVVTILLLRPWLRRIRLPYYARVSVILCVVSMTMVGALLVGPWMRSDLLWGVAYFPVIVLGMLAEGIARTVDRDNVVTATWLAVTTVLLAFLMALVCSVPWLQSLLLQFPEFALTQIVAIVMISEFLDLRLLQAWDSRVAGVLLPRLFSSRHAHRVAVVRNRIDADVLGSPGRRPRPKDALRSVQKIVDALREGGHVVKVMEGDASLLKQLREFLDPGPGQDAPSGIVLNLAHGAQGDARATHVPAILEMSGIPYVGPTPLGHAMTVDRALAKGLLQQIDIPTPAFRLMEDPKDDARGLRYPALVMPRNDPNAKRVIVEDRRQLRAAVKRVVRRYRQPAFVEEYVTGRHISVALLGNDPVECLPLVEVDSDKGEKVCPAPIDRALARRIREYAKAAFRACGCRDYARVDVRVGESDDPWVLEVRTLGILARGGSFVRAGARAGYSFNELVCRIVEVARARYLSGEPLRPMRPRAQDASAPASLPSEPDYATPAG